MIIEKVYNNNIVLSHNDSGEEVIVMGRGLAFQKQKGDLLEESLIEKVFLSEKADENAQLKKLIQDIDLAEIELSKEIILMAEKALERPFSNTIYLSFTDHLHYTIERARDGVFIPNPLLYEIKRFYPKEFKLAKEALKMIEERLNLSFPESEAAFIALHLANNMATPDGLAITMKSTEIVRDILSIISTFFGLVFDETSLSYTRMVTHLQYFVQRILTDKSYEEEDDFLYELVQSKYPRAFKCGLRIKSYLENNRTLEVRESEMIYLVIHINRVVQEADKHTPS